MLRLLVDSAARGTRGPKLFRYISSDTSQTITPRRSLVLTETKELVGTITLNNTAKRNALSAALVQDLMEALDKMQQQKMRAVIIVQHLDPKYGQQVMTLTSCPMTQWEIRLATTILYVNLFDT